MVSLEELAEILRSVHVLAIVGAARAEHKAGHSVPAYLQEQGYEIIPVNPHADEVFGIPCVPTLADIGRPVDMVVVFRPPAEAEVLAKQTAAIGARVIWFQPGTASDEGIQAACDAGLRVVSEACAGVVHRMISRAVVR